MDGTLATLWLLRILFLGLLYLFLFAVVRTLLRDLRSAARQPGTELGRLVVLESPAGDPPVGRVFPLDAVTTLGRGVNNTIAIEDSFASADHAVLTFRGRAWYVEDVGSTNGTYLNGGRIAGASQLGFGDELTVGQARFRLERGRS